MVAAVVATFIVAEIEQICVSIDTMNCADFLAHSSMGSVVCALTRFITVARLVACRAPLNKEYKSREQVRSKRFVHISNQTSSHETHDWHAQRLAASGT